jgi:hypothetical protein
MGLAKEDIAQLAVEIAQLLPQTLPLSVQLWSGEDIARYLGQDVRHVMERVVTNPDFPKRRQLKVITGGYSQPRWLAREVIEHVESKIVKG